MRTRKVEIEIPEDMEVAAIRPINYNSNMVLELRKRKPRRFVFEEVIGKTKVSAGDYWMNTSGEVIMASGEYPIGYGNIPLRVIKE